MINKNVNYKGYYKNNILLVGFTSCYVTVASTNDQKSCHMYAEVVFILYFFLASILKFPSLLIISVCLFK